MDSLFGYFVAVTLCGYGIILRKIRNNWMSPDVFFCILWGCISFLASLRLYGMWGVSSLCWFLVFFGSASFVLGAHISYFFSVDSADSVPNVDAQKKDFNKKLFFFLIICLYINAMPSFMQSLRLMLVMGVNMADIRHAYFGNADVDGFVRSSGFFVEMKANVFFSIKAIVFAVGINRFFLSYGEKKYLIPVLGLVVMEAVINGGRFIFAYFFVEFISCYLFYNRNKDNISSLVIVRNLKNKVKLIGMFPLIMVVIVTIMRGAGEGLLTKYYRYFCGCIGYFNQNLEKIRYDDFYSLSFASLYGLWYQILVFLRGFAGIDYPEIFVKTKDLVLDGVTFRQIGDHMYTNAFITPFYHLYFDFRFVGVFIGMFLFGFFSQLIYRKASVCRYMLVLYLIFMQFIFNSLQSFPLTAFGYVDCIIMLLFIKFFRIPVV